MEKLVFARVDMMHFPRRVQQIESHPAMLGSQLHVPGPYGTDNQVAFSLHNPPLAALTAVSYI
eukprot:scaffold468990_cov14-Prasinocladus_malaysianus.AAC.1